MIWLKRLVITLVLAAIVFLAWSWQFGPLRMKRDISQFAENMASCTGFDQNFKDAFSGKTMNRVITGVKGETCGVVMQTYSPKVLACAFDMKDMPELARAFARQADNIGFFGGVRFRIDTQSTNPLQQAMNSPACEYKDG